METEERLIASFKKLMIDHPFNKITIKMITDSANVIRPTFYNYFQDKYEIFSVILEKELFNSLHSLIEVDMLQEAAKMIFVYFDKNRAFYKRAFEVDGQNSFEEILINRISNLILHAIQNSDTTTIEEISILTKEQLAKYYSLNLVLAIKMWFQEDKKEVISADKFFEVYTFLITHDFQDFFNF